MLTLNVTNRIIMKITVWLIPTRQRFDNCLLKKFNYMNIPRHLVTLTGVGTLLHKTKIQQKMNQWSFLLYIVIYLCQFLCKLRKGKL
jgi:hypothetical protein